MRLTVGVEVTVKKSANEASVTSERPFASRKTTGERDQGNSHCIVVGLGPDHRDQSHRSDDTSDAIVDIPILSRNDNT